MSAPYPGRLDNPQRSWPSRHPVLLAALVVVGLCGGGSILGAIISAAEPDVSNRATAEQREFVAIVRDYAEDADDANEIAIVGLQEARDEALCDLLDDGRDATDWAGTVEDVETTLGGDGGIVTVSVGKDIQFGTWNNTLSDIGSNTLVSPDDPLYRVLGDLDEGDEVTFSGQFVSSGGCLEEQSLIDENSLRTPTFSFVFTEIDPD